MMRPFIALGVLTFAAAWGRADSAMTAIDLFGGKDLAGWTLVTPAAAELPSVCTIRPDGIVGITGTPTGYLMTEAVYENFELHLEYRWPADAPARSNGGILLHIASAPVAPSAWPTCLQLQLKVQCAGDLLQMFGATFAEPITSPAKGNVPPLRARQEPPSEKPLGEWNSVDVLCRDGLIEVRVNGVLQNRVTQAVPRAGRIGLQLEGTPYELRQVRLAPLTAN